MPIQHVYSQTVADGTATSVVRPSDWNSNHNMVLNMGGNTAGTAQIAGQDIVWAGGNNITLSANGSTVSIVGTQTVQTQPAGNIAGVGTTYAGTDIAATIGLNSNGLALSLSKSAGTDFWVATGANTIAGQNTTGSWTHDSYIVSGAGVASVGVTGGTLIVSVPSGGGGGGYTYTRWPSPGQNISSITSAALTAYNGSLIVGAELAGVNISATGVALVMGHSVQSSYNTLQNGSLSLRVGIYSRTNDTQLTLLSSGSTSFAMSWSSSTTTGVQGMRELYVPMNVNMPVGEYFIARNMSYTGDNASAATAHTVSLFGVPMQTNVSNAADGFGIATLASNAAFIPFQGVYSTTTNAMPGSIGLTQVTMSGSAVAAGNFYREYH